MADSILRPSRHDCMIVRWRTDDGTNHAHQDQRAGSVPAHNYSSRYPRHEDIPFSLPASATLDMFPGDYLYVHATINGKAVKRPYTPSSMPGATGYFDLTVKRYENGLISKYLHEQKVGDTVLMRGQTGAAIGSMVWRRRWG